MRYDLPGQGLLFPADERQRKSAARPSGSSRRTVGLATIEKVRHAQEDLSVLWADSVIEYGDKLSKDYTSIHPMIAKLGAVIAAEVRRINPGGGEGDA